MVVFVKKCCFDVYDTAQLLLVLRDVCPSVVVVVVGGGVSLVYPKVCLVVGAEW